LPEQAASQMVAARNHLNHAPTFVATSVFFNPDLTPAEAERAYNINRRERRNKQASMAMSSNLTTSGNNNNNNHDNVYGAVIMAEPLREFTRFI